MRSTRASDFEFATMAPSEEYADASDVYHSASKIVSAAHYFKSAYELNYDPSIMELSSEAPTRYSDVPKFPLVAPEEVPFEGSLETAILNRESVRAFSSMPLPLDCLSKILYMAVGIRRSSAGLDGNLIYKRNVPNSGNLGSVELYLIATNVDTLPSGIYHYDTIAHELSQISAGQYKTWLRLNVLSQLEFSEAAVTLILSSAVGRLKSKYGQRGYRLSLIDVGHVSAHLYLAATGTGIGVCATAGFIEAEVDHAIGIDGLETCSMLAVCLGELTR